LRKEQDPGLSNDVLKVLHERPEECAYWTLSSTQKGLLVGLVVLLALLGWFHGYLLLLVLNGAAMVFYIVHSVWKFWLVWFSLEHKRELSFGIEELAALDEEGLPTYTVLVPLYREAEVLPNLVSFLSALDYPTEKLHITLLIEEDDAETKAACDALRLPAHFHPLIVPDSEPKTKPKACNYGLFAHDSDLVVIYDAEDHPEPDQLKKAAAAFAELPDEVVCLQAKLNYYNQRHNLLTRWFTSEYSVWFDLFLPGLTAAKAPIPLGGTSNHFRSGPLKELGGCLQTYLVHMRDPLKLLRQLGLYGFFGFQMTIGGSLLCFLLNPIYWVMTALWFTLQPALISAIFPPVVFALGAFCLFVGNFVFVYLAVAGCANRGYYDLVKHAVITPLYWLLMSVGAYKAFIQLIHRPHYWEKTQHGQFGGGAALG